MEEEETPAPRKARSHSRTSHSSHSRNGSRDREVYVEREIVRERMPPRSPPREEYETFRYVPAPGQRERDNDIYDDGPRVTSRVVERERIRAVDDEARRGEYYRRY